MHGKLDTTTGQEIIEHELTPRRIRARLQHLSRHHPYVLFMGVVTVGLAFYFSLIAAPMFVSETQISIRGKESGQTPTLFAGLVPSSSGGISESVAVREYIRSPQLLDLLDERHQLFEHYTRFRIDPFSTLSRGASREDFLQFYNDRVDLVLDREAAILKVGVKAYDPEIAFDVASSIVELSEQYINDISARIREETLRDARNELDEAANRVRDVRLQLADFRNQSGELDPASTGAASVSALIALEADITRLRGELASQLTINRADAPQVRAVEAQIASLERQAQQKRRELASVNSDGTLAEVLRGYEGLLVEREYAETRLTAALATLDSARQLADQRERFVVTIVEPIMPSEATEPRRLASFLLGLVLATIGYGIVRYTIAGIQDHDGR